MDPKSTELFEAIEKGEIEKVRELLEHTDVNIRGQDGLTPLHVAAHFNQTECVNLLIEKGASLDGFTTIGESVLGIALSNNSRECVYLLMKQKAPIKTLPGKPTILQLASLYGFEDIVVELLAREDVDEFLHSKDVSGRNAVHYACVNGHSQIVKSLLAKGANAKDADNNGLTCLHYAGINQYYEIVPLLIAAGSDINETDEENKSLLHYAAHHGRLQAVKDLIQHFPNLNLNLQTKGGKTPLMLASAQGFDELVETLLAAGAKPLLRDNTGYTALGLAAHQGHLSTVKILLKAGVGINEKAGEKEATALSCSCQGGKFEVAKFLLESGADPNITESDGRSCLQVACTSGSIPLTKLLLSHNADLYSKHSSGMTVLHAAAMKSSELVNILLDAGYKGINDINESGLSVLHFAAATGSPTSVEALIKGGGDVNLKDPLVRTPLHISTASTAQVLISNGADVNAVDKNKKSPLHTAVFNEDLDLVKVLLNAGADRSLRQNRNNWTPLQVAVSKKNIPVIKILLEGTGVTVEEKEGGDLHFIGSNDILVQELLGVKKTLDEEKAKQNKP
eukprot:TRINITY_DN6824_c0_g1_i1.p1 TRINITY_DN6824_c0_g1~~TRINITY_DN6824_c0_g1_i1.p1  ORF type:complete len:566 (-),score=113.31 TRINITY_DN6824_c0_g1_i1:24-1721(-)